MLGTVIEEPVIIDGTLTVKDADDNLALVSGLNTIPAGTNIVAGTSAWGYKVNGGAYTAITAADASVHSSDEATMGGDITNISYGVSTSEDQAAGVYTDTIVFTATTK